MSRKKVKTREPYQDQDYIVEVELSIDGKPVRAGTLLRIKHDKTAWTYLTMYHNVEKDVQWVNLRSPMGFKSVRPDRIAGEYIQKRSRRKKSE